MSNGPVVATDVTFSALDKGRGVPADAQGSFVANEGVVLVDGWRRINRSGGVVFAVASEKLVGDGRVVLADRCRRVNGDGGAVPTVKCRKLTSDGRAALASGDRRSLMDGREVGTDSIDSIESHSGVSINNVRRTLYTTYLTNAEPSISWQWVQDRIEKGEL